jgi:hypothetical protein
LEGPRHRISSVTRASWRWNGKAWPLHRYANMTLIRSLSFCFAVPLALFLGACGSDAGASGAAGGSAGSDAGSAGTGAGTGGAAPSGGAAGAAGGQAGAGGAGASSGGADSGTSNFDPYFFDDFESYAEGASLSNNQPFDAAGRSTASSERAHRGAQSAKMEIRAGDGGGFGKWGGIVPIKPALGKDHEIWVRLWVLWPASFEFSASPWMKFLRLHNQTFDGKNGGYNDLYVDNADATTSVLRTIKEVHDKWAVYDGASLPRDTWERYEMYLYIDHLPVDAGGGGRVRIWRDDQLIFDRTDVPTITEAGGKIDYFYLFTYWNNEQPPNNSCYVDDLAIATSASPPPNTDTMGNAYIGDW